MEEIFNDGKARMDNIKNSADKLGIKKPDETKMKREPEYRFKIKKSCKMCWGRGTVMFQRPKQITQSLVYCSCVRKVEVK